MAAVAAAKGFSADGFSVRVRMGTATDGREGVHFESDISLSPRYSERERVILFNSARRCEVRHMLSRPILFQERLLVEDGEGTSPGI